jgi:hypothetical protein
MLMLIVRGVRRLLLGAAWILVVLSRQWRSDDCTVRDEWFIKRSLELRSKMIIIEMSEVQEEQVEQRLFMPALRS